MELQGQLVVARISRPYAAYANPNIAMEGPGARIALGDPLLSFYRIF